MPNQRLSIKELKQFEPLKKLNDQQLILLGNKHEVKTYKRKQVIFEADSADNIEYFLLEGKLQLTAKDGRSVVIDEHSKAARNAISHLQPRQFDVRAVENSRLLQIDWSILAQFMREAPNRAVDAGAEVTEFTSPRDLIMGNFRQDLANNTLTLPSLPDTAMKINELVKQDDYSIKDVARLLGQDPAMVVKIISAANSPLFRGMSSIKTCEDAVSRLGLQTTQQLLRIYSLRELFSAKHPVVKAKMESLWAHCESVAAIAFVLAKKVKGLSPDEAMLAGLIHDVGSIPLLSYIESQNFLFDTPETIDEAIDSLKAEVGVLLLKKWHWSAELISVVANADNWNYSNDSGKPDYVDLVIIAQFHEAIGKPEFARFPPLHKLASFARMGELELTPDRSLKIIQEARAEIDEARQLLTATA